MSIGAMLRHARETRALTSDDLARTTRIPLRMIAAMEKDDWSKLPGGIFTRGYLRAYAREVGIDADLLVARFQAEHAPPPPPEPAEVERAAASREWRVTVRWPELSLPESSAWRRLAWPAFAAAVLLVLYLTAGRTAPGSHLRPAAPQASAANDRESTASSLGARQEAPVGTAAMADAAGRGRDIELPLPGTESPLAMEFSVTRPCWVTMTVDGSRQIYRLVQPGERERQQGREFVIRAGDAGALQLALDGAPARPLGASGEVLTLRITRENYRGLLQPATASF